MTYEHQVIKDDDQTVMNILVRSSLNMSPGKIAAQVGHAVQYCLEYYYNLKFPEKMSVLDIFNYWKKCNYTKIILSSPDSDFERAKSILEFKSFLVIDSGKTEINPNTQTVLGFFPMKKSQAPKIIKKMRLL